MRLTTLARTFIAFASTVLLSSCLDYEEQEMVIHDDLSGEAVVKLTLPDVLLTKFSGVLDEFSKEKLEKRFDLVSGVTLAEYVMNSEKRRPELTLHVKFVSLKKLDEALAANPPAAMLAGRFEVTRDKGLTTIDRKLGTVTPKDGIGEGNYAMYVMRFESPIAHTNSGFEDGAHYTVRYRHKVDDVISQQPVLSNSIAKPFPWVWILLSLVVVGGGAYFGWQKFGTRKVIRVVPKEPETPVAPTPEPAPPPPDSPAPGPRRPGPPMPRRPGPPR